jgi:hypothetical protein
MIKIANIEKNSIMNIYNDYLRKNEKKGLNSKPIDGAELLIAILHKLKIQITQIAKSP